MATDYDAPHRGRDDPDEDSPREVKAHRVNRSGSAAVEVDEVEQADRFELPGADLGVPPACGGADEHLSVRVVPQQTDEFTCSVCFTVRHRSQLASTVGRQPVCRDCAT